MSKIYIPESALAIVAHPDDIDSLAWARWARWIRGGARVAYVLCTSGDAA